MRQNRKAPDIIPFATGNAASKMEASFFKCRLLCYDKRPLDVSVIGRSGTDCHRKSLASQNESHSASSSLFPCEAVFVGHDSSIKVAYYLIMS